MEISKPFSDLTVIELAGVLAGPSVGYFFAELGAKVIKIENPRTQGDVTRSWKASGEDPKSETSAYFWSVNAGKAFLQLDLTEPRQREELYDLVKKTDVVITNYKSGDDKKLGVDYQKIAGINPKIIYASINGFGPANPRTAYDLILQAESGFMSMNGEASGPPLKMPVALIDLIAGHQLKEAILIALLRRERTGKGSMVSVSLFDAAVASLANQATNWLIGHKIPSRTGSLHPNIAPYGELFETKDKQLITFAIGSNAQFSDLCEMLELRQLITDSRFKTNHARVANRNSLYTILYDRVRTCSFGSLYNDCLKKDVPIGKIRDVREVFATPDAQQMLKNFQEKSKTFQTVKSIAFRFHD